MPSQEIFEFVLNTNFSNITRKKKNKYNSDKKFSLLYNKS